MPKHISIPISPEMGCCVVTHLIISHGRIIVSTDSGLIHVYSPMTGELVHALDGHRRGVWSMAVTKDTLISGSTDKTVRVWDLKTGLCTHIFGGHTSTVRCLSLVKPQWINVPTEDGTVRQEIWPKRTLIVTGSRDHTCRVWTLPMADEVQYKCCTEEGPDGEVSVSNNCQVVILNATPNNSTLMKKDVSQNPYHVFLLDGHDNAVRALAAHGRTAVSGSFDCTVRVWDIITGQTKWILAGHTQKVYGVAYDHVRCRVYSGSMDSTVRIWDITSGQCLHTLSGHTSLVGLVSISPSYLVSAAADGSVRIWDPDTGEGKHVIGERRDAITCIQHDDFKILAGTYGVLKMWDVRDGSFVRDMLKIDGGVWAVAFKGRWCVAASFHSGSHPNTTVLDVWDFGKEDGVDEPLGVPMGEGDGESSSGDEAEELNENDDEVDGDRMSNGFVLVPPFQVSAEKELSAFE